MRYLRLFAAAILTALTLVSVPATAATTPKNKGLLISPLKSYTAVNAGSQKNGTFTVANLTDRPLTVEVSVKQFSVSDYAYNFNFSEPKNSWISLSVPSVELKPNENKKIDYHISVPSGSAPGGYYYTFFASAQLSSSGLASTVRAANLLYLTVNGKLIQTSTPVNSGSERFAYKNDIPYFIDVKNTGNVHFFANFSGELSGLLAHTGPVSTSHLLLPGTTRHVEGTIPAPLLPGIYKTHFGYKTDVSDRFTRTSYVVYLPPWSVAALILMGFIAYKLWRRHKTVKNTDN